MAWTQEKIDEIYLQVQKNAQVDEEFRAELLKDPSKVIAELAGEEVPEEFKIRVIENDPAYSATFVLPPMVSEELEDGDLDGIAGGACVADGNCGANACAAKASVSPCLGNKSA